MCRIDDADEMGTEYLRECESAAHAQMVIRQTLHRHGTTDVSFNNIQCDYDGSYGKYKIANGMSVSSITYNMRQRIHFQFNFRASCLWRNNTPIGSFQAGANLVGQMNCCKLNDLVNRKIDWISLMRSSVQIVPETINTSKKLT